MNRKIVSATIGITFIFALLAVAGLTGAQYVLGSGIYDETVPMIATTGTWTTASNAGYYGGTGIYATGSNGVDTISFSFYGDSFTLIVLKYSAGGNSDVCIDSVCSVLNNYNATALYQSAFTYSGLDIDTHTVEIFSPITGNFVLDAVFINAVEPASGGEITVQVTVEVTAEIVIEQTEEPYVTTWDITDSEENIQTVAFEYKTDIGQFIIILMLFGVLLLGLIGLVFQVWAHFQNDTD